MKATAETALGSPYHICCGDRFDLHTCISGAVAVFETAAVSVQSTHLRNSRKDTEKVGHSAAEDADSRLPVKDDSKTAAHFPRKTAAVFQLLQQHNF